MQLDCGGLLYAHHNTFASKQESAIALTLCTVQVEPKSLQVFLVIRRVLPSGRLGLEGAIAHEEFAKRRDSIFTVSI